MFFICTYSFETEGRIEGENTGKFGECYGQNPPKNHDNGTNLHRLVSISRDQEKSSVKRLIQTVFQSLAQAAQGCSKLRLGKLGGWSR